MSNSDARQGSSPSSIRFIGTPRFVRRVVEGRAGAPARGQSGSGWSHASMRTGLPPAAHRNPSVGACDAPRAGRGRPPRGRPSPAGPRRHRRRRSLRRRLGSRRRRTRPRCQRGPCGPSVRCLQGSSRPARAARPSLETVHAARRSESCFSATATPLAAKVAEAFLRHVARGQFEAYSAGAHHASSNRCILTASRHMRP